MTDFDYKFLAVWMTLGFILQVVLNLATNDRMKDLEQKVTQERNVAITFCVENPIDCKTEYLKLK